MPCNGSFNLFLNVGRIIFEQIPKTGWKFLVFRRLA